MSRTAKRRAKVWNEKVCPVVEVIGETLATGFFLFLFVIVSAIIIVAA